MVLKIWHFVMIAAKKAIGDEVSFVCFISDKK